MWRMHASASARDLPYSRFFGPNGPDRPDGRFYFSDNAESPLGPLGPSGPFKTLYAGAIPVFFNSVFRFFCFSAEFCHKPSMNLKIAKKCKCPPKIFTIYEVNYQKSIESDVQNLHIAKLEVNNGLLLVKTEKGGIFSCNITTGKIKLLKLPQGYEQIKSSRSVITLKMRHFIRQNR